MPLAALVCCHGISWIDAVKLLGGEAVDVTWQFLEQVGEPPRIGYARHLCTGDAQGQKQQQAHCRGSPAEPHDCMETAAAVAVAQQREAIKIDNLLLLLQALLENRLV